MSDEITRPYYESHVQRLYRFPNGHGASVVEKDDGTFDLAVIHHTGEMMDGQERWYIDYHSPFGMPKTGFSDDEVAKHLAEIESGPKYSPSSEEAAALEAEAVFESFEHGGGRGTLVWLVVQPGIYLMPLIVWHFGRYPFGDVLLLLEGVLVCGAIWITVSS
jgi:hypothetical protein